MGRQPEVDIKLVNILGKRGYPYPVRRIMQHLIQAIDRVLRYLLYLFEGNSIAELDLYIKPAGAYTAQVGDHFIRQFAVRDNYCFIVVSSDHRIEYLYRSNRAFDILRSNIISHFIG